MANFRPKDYTTPTPYTIVVEDNNGDEFEIKVSVRLATTREEDARQRLGLKQRVRYGDGDSVEVQNEFTRADQRKCETYLTLSDCDLKIPDEQEPDKFVPLFRFRNENGKRVLDHTEDEFEELWGQLPSEWSTAIHEEAVLKKNPKWKPGFRSSKSAE